MGLHSKTAGTAGPNGAECARVCEEFGERYGFTDAEKEALRLGILIGLENEEIAVYMKVPEEKLEGYQACMAGKTRTRSVRELQALFLRYVMKERRLPAPAPEAERECVGV